MEKQVEKIQINDSKLKERVKSFFNRLEKIYEEHKIYSFDSLGKDLARQLRGLYIEVGYESAEDMLLAYGYEKISSEEAIELRGAVSFEVGKEPDVIKNKVDNFIKNLREAYPNGVIEKAIQSEHKSLGSRLTGLYIWLGYRSAKEMLSAYGFDYRVTEGRSVKWDKEAILRVVNSVVERYKTQEPCNSFEELLTQNPDLADDLNKILKATSHSKMDYEIFGVSLNKHLQKSGVIKGGDNCEADIEDLVKKLKERYEGKDLETTYLQLSSKNEDLFVSKNTIKSEIFKKYNLSPYEFFAQEGLIVEKEKNKTFLVYNGVLKKYSGNDEEVEIPNNVTSIGAEAFSNCENLKTVIIPDSVTSIRSFAFDGCKNLSSVIIPKKVTSLGDGAFRGCESLESISIPNSVLRMGAKVFYGCSSLKNITLSNACKVIKTGMFYRCVSLESISLPQGVKEIQDYAFYGCSNLKSISLDSNSQGGIKIGDYAFYGCNNLSQLKNIELSNLGVHAFEKCFALKHANFYWYTSMKELPKAVFKECKSLQIIDFWFNAICDEAFYGCESLWYVKFTGAARIGAKAFYGCTNLKQVKLNPKAKIEKDAFEKCNEVPVLMGDIELTTKTACDGIVDLFDYKTEFDFKDFEDKKVFVLSSNNLDGYRKERVDKFKEIVKEFKGTIVKALTDEVDCVALYEGNFKAKDNLSTFDKLIVNGTAKFKLLDLFEINTAYHNYISEIEKQKYEAAMEKYKNYWDEVKFEDFENKWFYLLHEDLDDRTQKEKLSFCRKAIKEFKGRVAKTLSDKVKYVVICNKHKMNDLLEEFEESIMNGSLKIKFLDIEQVNKKYYAYIKKITQQKRKAELEKYSKETAEERMNRAVEIYNNAIEIIEKKMDSTQEFNAAFCGITTVTKIIKDGTLPAFADEAYEFFKKIENGETNYFATKEDIENPCKKEYQKLLSGSSDICDGYLYEVGVAVCVAYFVFVNPNSSSEFKIFRDKWEARGDYVAKFGLYWELNLDCPDGKNAYFVFQSDYRDM